MANSEISIPKRLYAFAIDLGIVVTIKLVMLQILMQYLQLILWDVEKILPSQLMEDGLQFFMYSLFPILWLTYSTLSTYLYGATMGSKKMGYHFEQADTVLNQVSLSKAFLRSIILLATIYSWGTIYLFLLIKNHKLIAVTDLVENLIPVSNKSKTLPVPLNFAPPQFSERINHLHDSAKADHKKNQDAA